MLQSEAERIHEVSGGNVPALFCFGFRGSKSKVRRIQCRSDRTEARPFVLKGVVFITHVRTAVDRMVDNRNFVA